MASSPDWSPAPTGLEQPRTQVCADGQRSGVLGFLYRQPRTFDRGVPDPRGRRGVPELLRLGRLRTADGPGMLVVRALPSPAPADVPLVPFDRTRVEAGERPRNALVVRGPAPSSSARLCRDRPLQRDRRRTRGRPEHPIRGQPRERSGRIDQRGGSLQHPHRRTGGGRLLGARARQRIFRGDTALGQVFRDDRLSLRTRLQGIDDGHLIGLLL